VLGRDDEAEAALLTAISLNSNQAHPAATFNLASLKLRAGDYRLAKTLYDEVLVLQPDNWRAVLNRGVALLGLGKMDQGHLELTKVLQMLGAFNQRLAAWRESSSRGPRWLCVRLRAWSPNALS
jgi:Flp pilus assembly protein TadD